MTISEISQQLRDGEISPVEITQRCLTQIERLNPQLNTFITVTAESALAGACAAEAEIHQGHWRGPLHGIPVGLKDLIDTAGILTTAGSAQFASPSTRRIPTKDAEVVRKLKQSGAVLIGKQNLHEFAYGGSSMISSFGPAHNPWEPNHIAGGSSGGSAAAVAAGMCYASIGTDTAGSVREPAALCGVVGLKPTYDAISAEGVFPLSASYDHVGPLTESVLDAAILLQATGAQTTADTASSCKTDSHFLDAIRGKLPAFRIGVPRAFFFEGLDAEVAAATKAALQVLEEISSPSRELNLPVPTDRTLQAAESYAAHAEMAERIPELYQPETLRRILAGKNITASQIIQGRRELAQQRQEIANIFKSVDLLITPTTPIPAPTLAELEQNPDQLRPCEILLLRNTRPFNVWGLPAISVPCGFTQSGLPMGLQIAGPHGGELQVLQLAYAFEQATQWYKQRPEM